MAGHDVTCKLGLSRPEMITGQEYTEYDVTRLGRTGNDVRRLDIT